MVPLDKEAILKSVEKTGKVVIVHEAPKTGGFGGEIAAMIAEEAFYSLDAPIKRVGAPFTPVPANPILEKFYLPNAEKIVAAPKSYWPEIRKEPPCPLNSHAEFRAEHSRRDHRTVAEKGGRSR